MLEWNDKKYYTSCDIAKKLNVCQNTVNRWRKSGKLKFIKLSSRKYLFTNKHIEDYLKGINE